MSYFEKTTDQETLLDEIYNFQEPKKRGIQNLNSFARNILENRELVNKIARFSLLLISFFLIIYGVYGLKNSIQKPFLALGNQPLPPTDLLALEGQLERGESASLASGKDTDEDGLTDNDELNVYNTSPYLDDSDSDGMSDKDEIKNGTHPNCLTGVTCDDYQLANNETQKSATLSQSSDLTSEKNFLGPLLSDFDSQQLFNFLEQNSSAAENGQNIGSSGDSLESILELDPAQMRQLLLNQGIESELLEEISDEDLKNLVLETLLTLQNQ